MPQRTTEKSSRGGLLMPIGVDTHVQSPSAHVCIMHQVHMQYTPEKERKAGHYLNENTEKKANINRMEKYTKISNYQREEMEDLSTRMN